MFLDSSYKFQNDYCFTVFLCLKISNRCALVVSVRKTRTMNMAALTEITNVCFVFLFFFMVYLHAYTTYYHPQICQKENNARNITCFQSCFRIPPPL